MEIYSPPNRNTGSTLKNELRNEPLKRNDQNDIKVVQNVKSETEPMGEWVKRKFYERFRAFFEYEEVP